ncbi:sensor histidine kinase [Harryflintia acetispora]|uniref:sensor histidine kinase n=1 Tax=Harryflintia acetispora TaxID=1849041 RepID=UPI00189B6B36|nr:sensor histidine kinase [Harryflintia acetispora]
MKRRFFVQNLLLILMPMMIPILILGSFSTVLVQTTIKEEVRKNSSMTLSQVRNSTELIFNELDTLSINFYLNASFVSRIKTLLAADSVNYDNANIQRWFSEIVNTSANAKPYIHSVYVYYETAKPNMFVSNLGITDISRYPDQEWYQRYLGPDTPQTFLEARNVRSYAFEDLGTPVVTVYRRLYSPGATSSDGMIVMNIRRSYLEDILSIPDSSSPLSIFLLDNAGNVLAKGHDIRLDSSQFDFKELCALPAGISSVQSKDERYVVSQASSTRYDIKFLSLSANSDIYRLPLALSWTTAALLLVSFLLGSLIAWLITRSNNRQLRSTLAIFERAESGQPLPLPPKRDAGAYDYIQQQIIRTFVEKSYLRLQLETKKYRSRSLELTALQAQINPHFLFNTLKTIFWKTVALTGDNNEASQMIEQLSEILQYSIAPSQALVTLEEEIRNTENYILIQKVRYKNRFEVIWEYDDLLLSQKVIRLLFQPFIENAIYHGCRNGEQKCFVRIRLRLRDGRLCVSIVDNGRGMPREELLHIRQKLAGNLSEDEFANHIGIANTSKRLQLFYGDGAGVRITSRLGMGTCIHFDLPQGEAGSGDPLLF